MSVKKFLSILITGCIFMTGCNIQTEEVVFTENAVYITDYDKSAYSVTSEQAMSEVINKLTDIGKWQDDYKLLCSGMVTADVNDYYTVKLGAENDGVFATVATLWVNAENSNVYILFDPTIDSYGIFSEYSADIPEDDFRTRLIEIA